jgi:hypothetical protein
VHCTVSIAQPETYIEVPQKPVVMGRAADSRSLEQTITVLRVPEFTLNRLQKGQMTPTRIGLNGNDLQLHCRSFRRILGPYPLYTDIAEATYSPWAPVGKLRHISESYWPNLAHNRERNHARFGTDQILGGSVVV